MIIPIFHIESGCHSSDSPRITHSKLLPRAFTLIELLVVIAIIAVVAGILFAVFARAREKGIQITCMNNLKQLGLGTLIYAQDYDERIYPYEYNGPSGPGDRFTWEYYSDYDTRHPNDYSRGLLYPYVKNVAIFRCPDAESFAGTVGGNSGSYGLNSDLFGEHINGTETTGIDLAAVQRNTETILIADAAQVVPGKLHGEDILYPPSERNDGSLHGLHNGTANIVWLDGHTKAMKPVCGKPISNVCFVDKYDLGTLLHGPWTGNQSKDDYYWELIKPD